MENDTTTTTETPAENSPAMVEEAAADLYNGNRATYSPEDNKLRLYVGRVPRDEYLKLRAEGWTALHKQREAGQGDFAATWTPSRRNTALEYAGIIEDEDAGPAERAADRAERFSGYRDKRTDEATGHADRYDAGPSAHGYQSAQRAERAARRHDAIGTRAVDAWEKAEYWTMRTAGVIAHALYKSTPGVRMGRINKLESELRRFAGSGGEWEKHYTLRLAYERQMLAAAGGMLEQCEVLPGGMLGGKLILKVNKSNVTGRAKSVDVLGGKVDGWQYRASNFPGTDYAAHSFDLERIAPGAYTPPTAESLAQLEAVKAEIKAAREKLAPPTIPLINPTDEDAERLQAVWNERAKVEHCAAYKSSYGKDYAEEFFPATVCRITQAVYSANSKGSYARAETRGLRADGYRARRSSNMYSGGELAYDKRTGKDVCTLRITREAHGKQYTPPRVIILTDKPQKPLPAAVWQPYNPTPAAPVTVEAKEKTIYEQREELLLSYR